MRYVLIVVGCILGAALLLILLLLFAPFRYRLTGEYDKEVSGEARIRWLFPLLSVRIVYKDGEPEVIARILGIRIDVDKLLARLEEKKEKKPKKQDDAAKDKQKVKLTFKEKLTRLYKEYEATKKLLSRDSTGRGVRFLLENVGRLLKSIRPRRVNIKSKIGTGDAYSLANILIGLSILYGLYGDSLDIEPDWENEVFWVKGMMKGRIIVFTLLVICIKVVMNRDLKRIKRGIEKIVAQGKVPAAA